MSRASAAVRFPDGTILYAMYCGTSDRLWPRLFPTVDAAWQAYVDTQDRRGLMLESWTQMFFPPEPLAKNSGEPVQIFEEYGGGFEWSGFATREFVTSECNLSDIDDAICCDEQPAWVSWRRED